ncbi:uncharacterized protein [Lolium perenne]|uniref:uncharacterized protein isoform X2 n=1 Tax=Lolium perenne TaxID=4522 RepID=UPI0021F566CD|nr:uncharacterized protein LOC127292592 isoform X2 [Lolium perenne]
MAHKRSLDAAVPEQEAAQSPRKRLQRAVFLVMSLERRRARTLTVEQMSHMVRQLDMAKLFVLVMMLVARLGSMESLLLQLPNMVQGLLAEQLGSFHRSVMVSMEEMILSVRRTEQPQAAALPNGVSEPSSSRAISECLPETGGSSGVVRLRFVDADRPKYSVFTRCPVKWQNGENPKVAIFRNEKKITGGDLSKLQIEILPVYADFFTERGHDDFTEEEFNKQIHRYNGNESVLKTVNLRNGEADLGSIIFKESSYRQNVRLAARVKRKDPAHRVQEAITDPFVVKDRRSESNEKSYLPSKEDAIHRLKKISQKGPRCVALAKKKVTKVKHLLREYFKDKSGLQELTGMKREDWHSMIKHATMCKPGDEIYSYRVAPENCELLFNDFYDLVGMMRNGSYVPASDLQFQQLNNWKMSAYKRLEERENSGNLIPDYLMANGRPVRAMPLNNEEGPSVQARMTGQYPNYIGAQQEFGVQQQNGFSPAELLSNNDAGPSKQNAPLFSHHTAHQDLGQHGPSMPHCHLPQGNNLNGLSGQPTIPSYNVLPVPEELITGTNLIGQQNGHLNSLTTVASELGKHHPSMPQNETPYYPPQENNLNGQGSFSGEPTIPSHIFPPVPKDYLITASGLIEQHNGHLSSSMTDAPGTSCPAIDGLSQATSSFNHADDDISMELSTPELQAILQQVNLPDQGFLQDEDAELPNFSIQVDGYEHDGGNL